MTIVCILCQAVYPVTRHDVNPCPRCSRFSWRLAEATALDKAIMQAHRPDPLRAVQN
jgi:hypothetical protein